jgi:phospholipid/cholesterol/gamma-HCH transport system permease protein
MNRPYLCAARVTGSRNLAYTAGMPTTLLDEPTLDQPDPKTASASGAWQVQALARPGVMAKVQKQLRSLPDAGALEWDLSRVGGLDHIGAQLLWDAWGKKRPGQLVMPPQHEAFFERLEQAGALTLPSRRSSKSFAAALHERVVGVASHVTDLIALTGQLAIDAGHLLVKPWHGPWKEISANVFRTGYQALGITALVGFLIGVVLSYLSALQLRAFGADVYLVDILGMGIIRELGPLLAAILVAGRSGSSITAQLGVMRVNEELDAMVVMGLPHGFRLILPKVIALAVAMPLLVVWTGALALAGGMVAANMELGMTSEYFLQRLPEVVPIANYWIGVGKGMVFGILIALIACHFGLRILPNTESLGQGTTASVVTAITVVILADAVFAIIFKNVGF